MPLVTQRGNVQYQPWTHSDMLAIEGKLPPITQGGSRWLSKLTTLCHGTVLSLGDIRCLFGQFMTPAQIAEIEMNADLSRLPHNTPLTRIMTPLSRALRQKYPIPPTTYQNITFKMKTGESGAAYIMRCGGEWEQMLDENHAANPVTRDIFRAAVLKGAPESVKAKMEDDPAIPGCTNEVWERYFVHHVDRATAKSAKDAEETDKLKNQLLKLQLDEARANLNQKKAKQMPQREPPVTDWTPQTPAYVSPPDVTPPFAYRRGGGNNRGRQNYNRQRFGGRGDVCFECGGSGHWQHECPNRLRRGSSWGPRGGNSFGRGRGQQLTGGGYAAGQGQTLSPMSQHQMPSWATGGGNE
ncbi:uncharacterized protein LOC122323396 [Puntigrus tetrazona]|uniref:uncharacterized protein LOC122323396 n=1 Tax=Puntigrus tetrazona TaxID=1606681 RepID=UPI001C8A4E78|nr:uncharacterized protein LOC122323396 [Puntigrus tetrazona]